MRLFGPPSVTKLILTVKDPGRLIEGLIKVLKGADLRERDKAVEALSMLGAPAVEPLIVALKDKKRTVRTSAAEALGQIGDARAVEPLSAALKDQDDFVRRAAAKALGQIGTAKAPRRRADKAPNASTSRQ